MKACESAVSTYLRASASREAEYTWAPSAPRITELTPEQCCKADRVQQALNLSSSSENLCCFYASFHGLALVLQQPWDTQSCGLACTCLKSVPVTKYHRQSSLFLWSLMGGCVAQIIFHSSDIMLNASIAIA